jgi:hypothetical protein
MSDGLPTVAAGGHLPIDTLLAWWLHETDAATTDAIDEHLMQCDACGEALDGVVALGEGVRAAFRAGLIGAVTTGAFVDRLVRRGVRVREYRLPHEGSVNCTVAPDDELLVARLQVPGLDGVERLDAISSSMLEPGTEHRLEDVPFDARSGEVLYVPKVAEAKRAPAHLHVVRLVAVGEGGVARELGTYRFQHRPWPGHGA